jgi:lipopolysaccharide transport system permease protein
MTTPARRHPDTSPPVTVYRPHMRHELGLFRTWAVMSRNIWGARELIWQLFKRDLLAGYKKSFVGFAWMFISPLMGIVSWVFLYKTGMFNPGELGIPMPAYVLLGTSAWGLFMGFYGSAASTLGAGSGLLMQVNYPHEALLFKQVANQLANYSINFLMNVVVLLAFKVVPSWGILLFPLVALPMFFLGCALGLMVALISVVAVDLTRFIGIGMSVLMYCTPVIYSPKNPSALVQFLNTWNPLTYLVCSCRDMIIYGRLYHPAGYFIAAGVALLAFLVSWRLFYVSEDKIIERMV